MMRASDLGPLCICVLVVSASVGCPGGSEASNPPEPSSDDGEQTQMIIQTEAIGEGPPLVMVGGGLTGWLSWIPHQERLASSRRVARAQPLTVQLGLEDRPIPDGYSIEFESAALAAAVDGFAPEGPIDLAGWSYGGHVALDYALDHPERIRTLTLIEPPAFWVLQAAGDPEYERERENTQALAERLRGDVDEEDLVAFLRFASIGPPDKRPQDLPQWPVWFEHRRSMRPQFDAEFGHRDTLDRIRGFDRPVMLVKGRGTTPALERITDLLAENFPNARLLQFDGGHAPHIVEMDPFMAQFEPFLADPSADPVE